MALAAVVNLKEKVTGMFWEHRMYLSTSNTRCFRHRKSKEHTGREGTLSSLARATG